MGVTLPLQEDDLRDAWVQDNQIDFGRLDEPAQQEILQRSVFGGREFPFQSAALQESNRTAIEEAYSPGCMLRRLQNLYTDLEPSKGLDYAEGNTVRDSFLSPEALYLLRT